MLKMADLMQQPVGQGQFPAIWALFKPRGRLIKLDLGTTAKIMLKTKRDGSAIWVYLKGQYIAKLSGTGTLWSNANQCSPEFAHVQRILKEVEADPAGVIGRYGIEGGVCCCCSRPLSDPVSIKLGIGPICMKAFAGLAAAKAGLAFNTGLVNGQSFIGGGITSLGGAPGIGPGLITKEKDDANT